MKNKLAFLFKFLLSFIILGLLWCKIYKYYVYILVRIISMLSMFSTLQRLWIRDEIIYFTFKNKIVKPIPNIPFENVLSITINIVIILSLLFATPETNYKRILKNILLAIVITFFIHVFALYFSIFSFKWGPSCSISLFKAQLSQWPQILLCKIGYFANMFWLQIGNRIYPFILWLILDYKNIFNKIYSR